LPVTLEEFYSIAVRQCVDIAHSYKSSLEAEASSVAVQTAVKLAVYEDDGQTVKGLFDYFLDIVKHFPQHEQEALAYMHGLLDEETGVLEQIKRATDGAAAVDAYGRLGTLKLQASGGAKIEAGGSRFSLKGDADRVVLTVARDEAATDYEERVNAAVRDEAEQAEFYADVMGLLDELRDRKARPTSAETFAIALSAAHLRQGNQQPRIFKPLNLPGRHQRHQSFVFVTDAGPDHIKITVQDRTLLDHGIVVHIEHIDRSETGDRSLMEAYRLPSHITAARVRLHVGDLAPTSCFIGRPTFEGLSFNAQYPHNVSGDAFDTLARLYCDADRPVHEPHYFFEATLLKAVHQTASACSAMFEAGIIDAKIAIENMTEHQAIRFMNAVVANVRRDPDRQYLSAAFNINRPIFSESRGKLLQRTNDNGLEDIAEAAVDITRQGNFDKVTLDGASERKGASEPIVEQLTHPQMLHFVHRAHEAGLITYLSAGIDASNLHKAVYTGVDGMGIGFALHAQNPDKKGVIAALSIDKINEVLEKRDQAENQVLGKAAKLLAHLDYAFFEGTLDQAQEEFRKSLFAALDQPSLKDICEPDVRRLLLDEPKAAAVAALGESHKIYSHAAQLLDNENCTLAQFLPEGWQNMVREMHKTENVEGLRLVLSTAQRERRNAAPAKKDSASQYQDEEAPAYSTSILSSLSAVPAGGGRDDQDSWAKLAVLTAEATAPHATQRIKAKSVHEESDLSKESAQALLECADGKVFIGVKDFPEGVTEADLLRRGAIVVKPACYIPFRVGRGNLYTAKELLDNDANIYNWYKHFYHNTYDNIMMALHDGVILDLLREEYAGKKQVGIMGGHAMLRDSQEYKEVALLCRELAQRQFVVATGGGPGAMEAANIGAHFSNYSEKELLEAIDILKEKPRYQDDVDNMLALTVLRRWPKTSEYSLGIPTWLYGHEPPNLFCKFQAKFFSNAVREDVLVLTCNCGIVYTPGSAGTRTEIAQFAVAATYSQEIGSDFSKPMIFYGNFWTENTLYQTYLNIAQRERLSFPRPQLHYSNKLYCVDNQAEILAIVGEFYNTYYPFDDIDRGVAPRSTARVPQHDYAGVPVAKRVRGTNSDIDFGKKCASYQAVDDWIVRNGMVIGVGSGTTVEYVVDRLAQLVATNEWHDIVCVPTSFSARFLLEKYSDVLTVRDMLTEERSLDLAIDGADEADACLRLIKGGGGALLHERVVGQSARHYIVVADWRKDSDGLGRSFRNGVPIEVQPLAWQRVQDQIQRHLQVQAPLRFIEDLNHKRHTPYVTDNGNYLLDAAFTEGQLRYTTPLLVGLQAIAGVCAVGLFPHLSTIAYFGSADGKVVTRTRVATAEADMLVSVPRQQAALEKMLAAVKCHTADAAKPPVVELDLDLTALMPYRRTIAGLMAAADDYDIDELKQLVQEQVGCLPGYTTEAWNEWLKRDDVRRIVKNYPTLPWEGSNEHKDTEPGTQGATVHSSFHRRFWRDAVEMADDIPTEGLADFERRVTEAGGQLVFVSGRWRPDMIDATYTALRRAGLQERLNVVIGNAGHDAAGGEKISDAEAKKRMQQQVNSDYGLPVAYIDDRISNLQAVASLTGGLVADGFVTVVSCVPGYSAAGTHTDPNVEAISNFYVERKDPQVKVAVDLAAPALNTAAMLAAESFICEPMAAAPILPHLTAAPPADEAAKRHRAGVVRVGTFNVENLFRRFKFNRDFDDTGDGFTYSDTHFSVMDEREKSITAAAIRSIDADVLALQEVESLDLLDLLNKKYLSGMYKYRVLIQGNDQRGINVAVMSRYPFDTINTTRFAAQGDTAADDEAYAACDGSGYRYTFSRDCLQVQVTGHSPLWLYVNHFKSMMGGRDKTHDRRLKQAERVKAIIEARHSPEINGNVIVLGDFNDYEDDNSGVLPLTRHEHLENVVKTRLPKEEQWTHYYARGNSYNQLDFLLVSPAISGYTRAAGVKPVIERRGQPKRANKYEGERFAGIGQDRPKASDHCPVTFDVTLND